MTDKKLLEEFREFIDFMYESIDLEDHQRFNAISESMLKDGWFKWIYKLAKEQAERVQGLERVNKQLKGNLSVYKGYYKNMIKINEGIVEQNKRYREAREIMEQVYKDNYVRNAYGYEDGYLDGLDTAMDIIDKALEGEE